MLNSEHLDKESRLEVIYKVLKDQLKRAKTDLLNLKRNRSREQQKTFDTLRQVKMATTRAKQQ